MIVRTTALFAVWLVLSLTLEPFYLGLGLITAFAVAWLNTSLPASGGPRWMGLVAYGPWVLWQVLLSGIHLAYLILHPRLPIEPHLIRYKTALQEPTAIVILGNSITLTPGTITAEVNGNELVVHAMDQASAAGLRDMEHKIATLFRVARLGAHD